jgi:hypothetical protein
MSGEDRRLMLVEVRCVVCDRPHSVLLSLDRTALEQLDRLGLAIDCPFSSDRAAAMGCPGCLRYTTQTDS